MNREKYSIKIKAPRTTVWKVMWDDAMYRAWSSVFSEGSHAESDWKEGGKILFLNGKDEGMYSVINKLVPNEFMSFKHLGVVKGGKELPPDDETRKWAGGLENYTLKESGGYTELTVEVDIDAELKTYFDKTFPKALEKLKALSEK